MSLDINVYCKNLSADLVPKIIKRLNEFDMIAEVHPKFKLDQENDSGFVPFSFRFKNTHFNQLKDEDLVSGFEIYISDFDEQETEEDDIEPEIRAQLKDCNKVVNFLYHMTMDSFEFRFALMVSAILTELTNGVCLNLEDSNWYNDKNIVEEAYQKVIDYEKTIDEKDLEFYLFDGWIE